MGNEDHSIIRIKATPKQLLYLRLATEEMRDDGRLEIKKRRIWPVGRSGKLMVTIESGLPGDEGTAASIYCRHYANFFIGPRGGLTAFIGANVRPTRIKLWQLKHLDVYEREARKKRRAS